MQRGMGSSKHYCLAYKQYGILDRDLQTVIGRTCHVTSLIWSRINWLTSPKIRIVGLCFADFEMDKAVHLEFYLPASGKSKHQFQ